MEMGTTSSWAGTETCEPSTIEVLDLPSAQSIIAESKAFLTG
jgi:hypothetical protein